MKNVMTCFFNFFGVTDPFLFCPTIAPISVKDKLQILALAKAVSDGFFKIKAALPECGGAFTGDACSFTTTTAKLGLAIADAAALIVSATVSSSTNTPLSHFLYAKLTLLAYTGFYCSANRATGFDR